MAPAFLFIYFSNERRVCRRFHFHFSIKDGRLHRVEFSHNLSGVTCKLPVSFYFPTCVHSLCTARCGIDVIRPIFLSCSTRIGFHLERKMADGWIPAENGGAHKDLRRRISNSAQSLNRFVRLPKPKKCRSWGRQLLRRWSSSGASLFGGFFASTSGSCGSVDDVRNRRDDSSPPRSLDADVFASLSSDYVHFGTASPPPKPPRVRRWSTVSDGSSPTDCEGSLTSVQSSGLLPEEEQEEEERRLLFLRFQLAGAAGCCSSVELSVGPADGVGQSSGATAATADVRGEEMKGAESLRTSGDETHPSGADEEDDDDQHDDGSNGHDWIVTKRKLLRPLSPPPAITSHHTHGDFGLEDARLLWLGWRLGRPEVLRPLPGRIRNSAHDVNPTPKKKRNRWAAS